MKVAVVGTGEMGLAMAGHMLDKGQTVSAFDVNAERLALARDRGIAAAASLEELAKVAEFYTRGPTRVQFMAKDPVGWKEFYDRFAGGSALGHANTMRGVQRKRPSIFELEARLEKLTVPTLIISCPWGKSRLKGGSFAV